MTPEFSRSIRLDTIGDTPRPIAVEASEEERVALARRFALVELGRLEAEGTVHRDGETVLVDGRLRAKATQSCVASGEPVGAAIDTPFNLRFVPEESELPEERELSPEDCDTLTYAGGAIDLGEAVAETLAVMLDPYPRSPDAEATLKAAGVVAEEEAGPFAALKVLRDKLGK
jgi:uncharacterized metal-binding protein YceD (DUF177 family)